MLTTQYTNQPSGNVASSTVPFFLKKKEKREANTINNDKGQLLV